MDAAEREQDRFVAGMPATVARLKALADGETISIGDGERHFYAPATVAALADSIRTIFVHGAIKDYLVSVLEATRTSPEVRLGASPRAGLQLLRAARARAMLSGRHYVIPDDIQALAGPALAHRMLLSPAAQLARRNVSDVVASAVASVPLPDRD